MKLWCGVPTVALLPTSLFPPSRISICKPNRHRFLVCSYLLSPRFSLSAATTTKKEEVPCKCGGYAAPSDCDDGDDLVVVNFYRFVSIDDPQGEVNRHISFLTGRDVHGRIYINEQGINAQYSGPSEDVTAYVEWLEEDKRFSDMLVQTSSAVNGHAFPKLKVQYKPLVQLEGGISHLPLLDPSMRAKPLEPSEWRKRLEAVNKNAPSDSEPNTDYILLDVRNGYEWDIGHFQGAQRPNVDCFRNTNVGISQSKVITSDPLVNADKTRTNVLMYCTGGIRCDVYATILRSRGFENLYTLKGGVSHYLENVGPKEWVGNLFVFDARLSLPPTAYNPSAASGTSTPHTERNQFANCYICGSVVGELRHRNCANIDCNLLFLCCAECLEGLRGCCCVNCRTAPRLRPVLPGHQRYKKWHLYRGDLTLQTK